jgi:Rieske Fe-S protein
MVSPNSARETVLERPEVVGEEEPEAPETVWHGRFNRRRMLLWLIGLSSGAFAAALALPTLALKSLSQQQRPVEANDVLVYSAGSERGQPFKPANLRENRSVQLLPQGKTDDNKNLIQVVRIAPGQGLEGLVAYSAICTHLSCSVLADLAPNGNIACPCHASLFDPRNDAAPVGGPANRPLPSLPIGLSPEGNVVATGPFEGPIGQQ